MATVDLEGLGKSYQGGVRAVEGVDLSIADGEFIVLVGPRAAASPRSCA